MSSFRGNIMMDPVGFSPEIMESSAWVQCEYSDVRNTHGQSNKTDLAVRAFNDDTFFYLPWELSNETEGLAFIEAYKALDLHQREDGLSVSVDGEPRTLPRTRATAWPSSSRIPVMVEWPHQRHADMCVLYSDGSVHRMKMGDGFPMTETFIPGMREIASLDAKATRGQRPDPKSMQPRKRGTSALARG